MKQLQLAGILALFLATPSFLGAAGRDETDLNKFIEEYFASWSRVDFEGYAHCFHPDATITYIGNGGLNTWGAAEFIADQRAMQTQGRSKEIPLSITTKSLWSHGAIVEVEWELTPGHGGPKKTGLDVFHIIRAGENTPWRIIYLSFWMDPTIGEKKASEEESASATPKDRDAGDEVKTATAEAATTEKLSVVVSGFGPFGGREVNASSELAKAIVAEFPDAGIELEIIPVVWGAPGEVLAALESKPDLWIAFGEGTKDFRIESLADNERKDYPDVEGNKPSELQVIEGGPAQLKVEFPVTSLEQKLTAMGYHCVVSQEAGNYLCEEQLYTLLHARQTGTQSQMRGLFIHVPVMGHPIQLHGERVAFEGEAFAAVARDFFPAILDCALEAKGSE